MIIHSCNSTVFLSYGSIKGFDCLELCDESNDFLKSVYELP